RVRGEVLLVDLVDGRPLADIGQVDVDLDDVGERATGRLDDLLELFERIAGLLLDVVRGLAGLGVAAGASSRPEQVADADAGAEDTAGGRAGRVDDPTLHRGR